MKKSAFVDVKGMLKGETGLERKRPACNERVSAKTRFNQTARSAETVYAAHAAFASGTLALQSAFQSAQNLLFLCLFVLIFVSAVFAQNSEISVIPKPNSVRLLDGKFKLDKKTKIVADNETSRKTAGLLNDLLLKNYGFTLEISAKPRKKNAVVFLKPSLATQHAQIGTYTLRIDPDLIQIEAHEIGQFYALQTLMQLLPVDFNGKAEIPSVLIADATRFSYRGMHLDVGRHFFSVEFIKKYLDLMAQYKFNRFHWHLTEDQGWRIEIKKYPKLTEIGSKRPETMKEKNFEPYVGDSIPVEGFYTQEQIKDVVRYAKERKITVIPEIELPGHSSAALAAYPELGCKENYQYKVQTTWGIFKEVFCPTETTFKFLEDVLEETIRLFPDSPYIHIGGDEVLKDHWKESAFVQELKQKENLKDEHEVQSYFIRRIEKFINSKGKRIIGWDEILEGGLAPNATVMSWRGMKGGIEAARAKHDVIMTPTDFVYFDYGQGDPLFEPLNIGSYVPLQKVYNFEPVPKELTEEERKYIMGGQANVWTEYMKTPEKVEYMVFPRMLALSEVLWTEPENKNYQDFLQRLSAHFSRLDKQNVNYRIPEPAGLQNILLSGEKETAEINLNSLLPNGKIFYTTDGGEPTEKANFYEKPFQINLKPNEKVFLRTVMVNEAGRKSVAYQAVIWRREPIPAAAEPKDKKEGVYYAFYKGNLSDAADAARLELGETKTLSLGQFREKIADKMPFGVSYEGYLYIPKDEIYEFGIDLLGSAVLWVDGEKVIEHSNTTREIKTGIAPLQAGYHKINLRYSKGQGEWALGLRFAVKGQPLRGVSELFH